jgi:acetylornithine deacetylase/succinyl-diaminopimelate desuccinylase-like protein
MSHHPQVDAVAALADSQLDATLELLCSYLRIPAISCLEAHRPDVGRLAVEVRDEIERLGFDHARVLEFEGAHPCVAAEWLHAGSDKPTVLIYGHLDLQPVEPENWRTDPHEPTVVGDRLYARGAADDMGGWVSHIGALRAWFEVAGGPPCNIKLIIEGEEEIGSPNLERFMDAHPDAFDSDVMILTDCENPSTDIPGLTVSLRGLIEVELTCSALSADVHSGLWGGMVPDVSMALVKLISRLSDDDGRMAVGRVEVDAARKAAGDKIAFTDAVIREGAHLIDGVNPLPVRDRSAAEWLWWQPCVTVVATTLPTVERKKNALRRTASAILSVRLAPEQSGEEMLALLREVLLADSPAGVEVKLTAEGWSGEGWLYTPKGPAFPAADRAYMKSWGKPLVQVGVGGSIPFVALFGRRFGDLPLILNGVMDPVTTAHGPNESLHLGVFRKAVAANVFLLDELAALGTELIRS